MILGVPEFVKSPYFYIENNRWKLRDDAPKELKAEFEQWFKAKKACDKAGLSV